MAIPLFEYDADIIKLYWQIEALKGQVYELDRERNRTHNLIYVMRHVLIRALQGIGVQEDFGKLTDGHLLALFDRAMKQDYRFSRCPNAPQLRCRPVAMQMTRDGDPVYCEDCGWSVSGLEDFPPQPE